MLDKDFRLIVVRYHEEKIEREKSDRTVVFAMLSKRFHQEIDIHLANESNHSKDNSLRNFQDYSNDFDLFDIDFGNVLLIDLDQLTMRPFQVEHE